MLERIERFSLTDAIIEKLKALILEGRLKPGDQIPSEKELCDQLGVSRTAIREAKKALVVMGLLDARPGHGTFVRDDLLDFITAPLSLGIRMERGRMDELFEVRLIVETAAAALAAQRAQDADVVVLRRLLDEQKKAAQALDLAMFTETDIALHAAIADATRNAVLGRVNLAVHNLVRELSQAVLQRGTVVMTSTLAAHAAVVEAIARHDAEGARKAMQAHLEEIQSFIPSEYPQPAPTAPPTGRTRPGENTNAEAGHLAQQTARRSSSLARAR